MEPLIVAHRGANRLAPENTAEAFVKAIELGADGVELDVRQTLDGVLAVYHNGLINFQAVKNMTFQQLSRAVKKSRGITVPTLEEVLMVVKNRTSVLIEIKGRGYEERAAQMALKILSPEAFFIISFNFDSLKLIKAKFPRIRTGLLLGVNLKNILGAVFFRNYYLKAVDLILPNIVLWKLGLINLLPKNIPAAVWTVNKPATIKRLFLDTTVHAVLTDDAESAIKLRGSTKISQ